MNHQRIFVIFITCSVIVGIVASVRLIQLQDDQQISSVPDSSTPTSDSNQIPDSISVSTSSVPMQTDQSFVATSSTSTSPVPVPRRISAKAYLVGDIDTGAIYIEHNSSRVLPVASMSKLVTAIVSTDTLSPTTTVLITPSETNDVATDTSLCRSFRAQSRKCCICTRYVCVGAVYIQIPPRYF